MKSGVYTFTLVVSQTQIIDILRHLSSDPLHPSPNGEWL